jgi:hypothetical protein
MNLMQSGTDGKSSEPTATLFGTINHQQKGKLK